MATGIDIKNAKVEPPHARRSLQEPLKPAPAPVQQAPSVAAAPAEPAPAPRASFEQPRSFAPEEDVPAPVYRPAAEQRPAQPAPAAVRDSDASRVIAPRSSAKT